jgi:gluconate 5-dehydrogenase
MDTSIDALFSLRDRVAFVPGGYGAIGEAICCTLSAAGARVAIAGRSADKAESLAARLRTAGCDAAGYAMDARAVADIRRCVDAVVRRFGALDILVNCVGMQREQRLDEVTEEVFDEVVQVNLKAAMFLAQAAARHQRDGGRQVHLLSVRAQLGLKDRGYSAYCSSKGALAMLVKQHAVELARRGITVNGVAPTVVAGEMARHWLDDPAVHARLLERIPLGRVAEPRDCVGATLFFCSPAAAFVTGQIVCVDGGLTATQ